MREANASHNPPAIQKGQLMPASGQFPENFDWHISRRCEDAACIMVTVEAGFVFVGQSGRTDGPFVVASTAEWSRFVRYLKLL